MPDRTAGILLYRTRNGRLSQVLLVHPGGPFWTHRDLGAWGIPKGLLEPGDDDALAAARREFEEETGFALDSDGDFIALGEIRLPSGKIVHAWAVEGDLDAAACASNTFTMEWPRGSSERHEYPEIDRAEWFDLATARQKISPGQLPLLERLEALL